MNMCKAVKTLGHPVYLFPADFEQCSAFLFQLLDYKKIILL